MIEYKPEKRQAGAEPLAVYALLFGPTGEKTVCIPRSSPLGWLVAAMGCKQIGNLPVKSSIEFWLVKTSEAEYNNERQGVMILLAEYAIDTLSCPP